MVHGLNEGHIAHYTDTELQISNIHQYQILRQIIILIYEETVTRLTMKKTNYIQTINSATSLSCSFTSCWEEVSNVGFIMVHGLNEGRITHYTDIEFQIPNIHHYKTLRQIIITDIWRNCNTIDNDETNDIKTIFHNRIKSRQGCLAALHHVTTK